MVADHFSDEKLEDESYDDEDDAAAGDLVGGSVLRLEVVGVNRVAGGACSFPEVVVLLILTEKKYVLKSVLNVNQYLSMG